MVRFINFYKLMTFLDAFTKSRDIPSGDLFSHELNFADFSPIREIKFLEKSKNYLFGGVLQCVPEIIECNNNRIYVKLSIFSGTPCT